MSLFHHVSRVLSLGGALSVAAAIGGSGVIALGSLAPTPAHADQWCHWIVGPVGPEGEPGEEVWVCEGPPAPDPDAYQDKWTAIAVSDTTLASGSSWQEDSKEAAERRALAECRKHASDCKVQDWGLNMCLALAISDSDRTWGVDSDRNGKRAQAKAMAQCQSANGRACHVVADPCSHDNA